MKTKRVNRYYCDYCKKASCSGGHMKKHEAGCMRNPNRRCGFCERAELSQRPMPELLLVFKPLDLTEIRKVTENCPACILAAIIQSKVQRPMVHGRNPDEDDEGFHVEFDFKKEKAIFWENINERNEHYR